MLSFQLPLIPGTFTSFIARQIERIIVRYQIDIASLGILEMAYKFPVLIRLLITQPFMRSWFPRRIEIADEPGAPERISNMFTYFFYFMLLGGLILAIDIPTILKLLTPEEFWPGFRPARVEILSIITMSCFTYLHFGLYYSKRTDILSRINIVTSIIKVASSYVMISKWGIYGAAWSGLITATIKMIWSYIHAQRFYPLRIDWRRITFMLGTAVVIFIVVDSLDTATITSWSGPLLERGREFLEGLRPTWLGQWKDGRVLQVLIDKSALVLDFIIRTLLASLYLLILPLVKIRSPLKELEVKAVASETEPVDLLGPDNSEH
jgi:O-antigen/teichoic acid export membrane protein